MATIWKSVLLLHIDVQEIEVPYGAEMLCAREQHDQICVWYRCDPMQLKEPRTIAIVGTGHPAPGNDGRYLGTAFLHDGDLVCHVFEKLL